MNFAPFSFQQQQVNESPLPSGIIVYYDAGDPTSYPGSGTTVFDISGFGRNGTLNAAVTFSTDNGGVFVFNGSNNVSISGATLNETLTEWTMWSSVFRTTAGSYDGIMFSRRAPGSANGIGIFSNTNRFNLLANNGTEITAAQSAEADVNLNTWCLVCAGVDSTTFFRQVFKNGTQNFQTGSKSAGSSNFDARIELAHDAEPNADRAMAGRIGVSIMWNRKLSQAEVTQVNNYFKARYGY